MSLESLGLAGPGVGRPQNVVARRGERLQLSVPAEQLEEINIATREDGSVLISFRLFAPWVAVNLEIGPENVQKLGRALSAPRVAIPS